MAISTLTNISVPTEGGGSNSSLLMPKLQYRFRVIFDGFGTVVSGNESQKVLTRQVVDVTRPNVSFEQITLEAYNSRAYMAGKHTWEPITLNLRDDASNNVQKEVGAQLQRQFDFYNQSSAVSANNYKFQTKIEILDGNNGALGPRILDSFVLVGCYVESANYNTLAYSTNDPATISLTIRYDNAIQYGNISGALNDNGILGIGGNNGGGAADGFASQIGGNDGGG